MKCVSDKSYRLRTSGRIDLVAQLNRPGGGICFEHSTADLHVPRFGCFESKSFRNDCSYAAGAGLHTYDIPRDVRLVANDEAHFEPARNLLYRMQVDFDNRVVALPKTSVGTIAEKQCSGAYQGRRPASKGSIVQGFDLLSRVAPTGWPKAARSQSAPPEGTDR